MARELTRVLGGIFKPQHYASLLRSHVYVDWKESFLKRYVLQRGTYPYVCRVRTPMGIVSLELHCPEDAFTVQEVFGLDCYRANHERVIVDFGANIGISAAYFLSRHPEARVHCFEPLHSNAAKLRHNLSPFAGRFTLAEVAVADFDGELSFLVEPTGRYSGIDNTRGEEQRVPCVNANRVLQEIIRTHGRIDLLKVDVEGAEAMFMPKLTPQILEKIGLIYLEGRDAFRNPQFAASKSISGVLRYSRVSARTTMQALRQ